MTMDIPSPKTVLRLIINFCLLGAGASAIWQASHVGPGYDRLGWIHELTIFFFFGLVAFALFFAEYQIVQGLTKRDLNATLGYVQSLGCFLLLLYGIWGIYYAHWKPLASSNPRLSDSVLPVIYIFGHLIFVGNIIRSYIHDERAHETSSSR
jgi:hypothetical protein